MTPVHCRVKHDPDAGTYGDCVRACVASILDLDAEEVPHFYHDNDPQTGMTRIRAFLNDIDLAPFFAHYDKSTPLREILQVMGQMNPNVHYILWGATNEGDHVVVAKDDKIVHNPSWYPTAIVKAPSYGMWSVMVIARR